MENRRRTLLTLLAALALLGGVAWDIFGSRPQRRQQIARTVGHADSLLMLHFLATQQAEEAAKPVTADRIDLDTALLYDRYTLPDRYAYGRTPRHFQWDKIREVLAVIENRQNALEGAKRWGMLANRFSRRGWAPPTGAMRQNSYGRWTDSLSREQYQGIPLYTPTDTLTPLIYGLDGTWAHILERDERWTRLQTFDSLGRGIWMVPNSYVRELADTVSFRRVVVADRSMQHVATLEKSGPFGGLRRRWLIRSMNPASTGAYNPPHQQITPLGYFVVSEKKEKMYYLVDGTETYQIEGFAPYASRFCNGAYVHGVPVNDPQGQIIEYLYTLGSIPRSHMCIRNASSHAQFVYEWAVQDNSLVVVIE